MHVIPDVYANDGMQMSMRASVVYVVVVATVTLDSVVRLRLCSTRWTQA